MEQYSLTNSGFMLILAPHTPPYNGIKLPVGGNMRARMITQRTGLHINWTALAVALYDDLEEALTFLLLETGSPEVSQYLEVVQSWQTVKKERATRQL